MLIGLGIVLAVAVRRNEAWVYVAAVVASALVTPAFYFQAMGLLAAAAAPWTDWTGWSRSAQRPVAAPSEVVRPVDTERAHADAERDQQQPAEADRGTAVAD